MNLGAAFLFLYAIILTLSPAVRYHTWQTDYRWTHWIGFIVWLAGFAVLHRLVRKFIPERDPYLLPIIASAAGNAVAAAVTVLLPRRPDLQGTASGAPQALP